MRQGTHATETVAALVNDALSRNATDIQLSCRGNQFEVRYCIDGLVTKQSRFANDELLSFSQAFDSFLEGPGRTDPGACADGVIQIAQPDGDRLKVKIARLPCYPNGYDLIAKILRACKHSPVKTDLSSLGYSERHLEELCRAAESRENTPQDTLFSGRVGAMVSISVDDSRGKK